MDAKRWQRVKDLFEAASTRKPEDRADFLTVECGDDQELRAEVESLLAHTGSTEGFLEEPLFERPPEASAEQGMQRERIGPYRLLSRLGQGGMGTVYLAARDDAEFEQRVAIKLIKRGMDTDEVIHRFRYERQILAALEHPQIARLYDGGTTEDGLPYFVMEHVDGQPIDQYCTERRLDLRERLELFRAVCEAVDFAHRNLVVHRDLKPANILVTPDGVPKLLDFGIARLLASGGQDPTQTVLGGRFLTPSYASPEQLRGEGITLASDVYSLGIVLFELLTSERPFADRETELAALGPAALDRAPRRPSSVARRHARSGDGAATVPIATAESGRQLGRRLAGDLDAIVLKAMRTAPGDRYRSAAELGEDVSRYLDGRPVEARRGSQLYLAGKFLQRNRVGVAVAALLVGLVVSMLLLWRQQHNAELVQKDSEAQAARANALERFLIETFEKSDPRNTSGQDLTASQLLHEATQTIGESLAAEPETQATLLGAMGQIYRRRGELDQAIMLFKESYKLRRKNLRPDHPLTLRSLNNLALAYTDRGYYALSGMQLREVLEHYQRSEPSDLESIGKVLNNLATVRKKTGDLNGAVTYYRQALTIKEELHGHSVHPDVAITLINLGSSLSELGQLDEAKQHLSRAFEMYEKLDDQNLENSRNALGQVLCLRGEIDKGEVLLHQSLIWRRKVLATQPEKIVKVMRNLAICREQADDLTAAETFLVEALALLEAEAPGSSEIAETQRRLDAIRQKIAARASAPAG